MIVEGTCGSGKTTLLRSAGSTFCDREVCLLAQRATYAALALLEDDGTLNDPSNRRILRDILARIRRELVSSQQLVLVDTLHATHFVRAGALTVASFVEIDREVADLDALIVVLRISERSIRARTIEGRRDTGFYEYARKFGSTEDELTTYFAGEQDRLVELLREHSRVRQVVLDADQPAETLREAFRGIVREHLERSLDGARARARERDPAHPARTGPRRR